MNNQLALVSSTRWPPVRIEQGVRLAQRILLHRGELYRVPPRYRQIRAEQGMAYVSHGGKDFIVGQGESVRFDGANDIALVSLLCGESLIVELFA